MLLSIFNIVGAMTNRNVIFVKIIIYNVIDDLLYILFMINVGYG